MEVVKAKKKKTEKKGRRKITKDGKLSAEEKEFVLAYIELSNATKAYMRAFPKSGYDSARVMACRMLARPNIKEAIQDHYQKIWDQKEKYISEMFNKLIKIAGADISDYMDDNGNVKVEKFKEMDTYAIAQYDQNIRETQHGVDVKRSIKLIDKRGAINDIAKILGMIQEKVEHSGTIEVVPAERPEEDKE